MADLCHLGQQVLWIDDGARAHNTGAVGMKDAARNQVQLELTELVVHRMARVTAALEAHTQVRLAAQKVHEFAFALVAPLCSNNNRYRSSHSGHSSPFKAPFIK